MATTNPNDTVDSGTAANAEAAIEVGLVAQEQAAETEAATAPVPAAEELPGEEQEKAVKWAEVRQAAQAGEPVHHHTFAVAPSVTMQRSGAVLRSGDEVTFGEEENGHVADLILGGQIVLA